MQILEPNIYWAYSCASPTPLHIFVKKWSMCVALCVRLILLSCKMFNIFSWYTQKGYSIAFHFHECGLCQVYTLLLLSPKDDMCVFLYRLRRWNYYFVFVFILFCFPVSLRVCGLRVAVVLVCLLPHFAAAERREWVPPYVQTKFRCFGSFYRFYSVSHQCFAAAVDVSRHCVV